MYQSPQSAQSFHTPNPSHGSSSQIELSVAGRRLVDRDITSKSDPQCIVYMKIGYSDKYHEIGRTEVIKDNLNPDWVKKFTIDYRFNESQRIKLDVWDVDPVSGNEFLGQIEVELAQIIATKGGTYKQPLSTGGRFSRRMGGDLLVRAEEVSSNKQTILMQFVANGLEKKDFLGKSDPYLKIFKANTDGTFTIVHETEVIKNNLNPVWRPFNISIQQLCNGDYDRNLKIECYDWDEGTNHDLIGSSMTTLRKLSSGPSAANIYECINAEKRNRKKGYKNSGIIKLNSISITQDSSFLDYIRGGTQMHFAVAIDFTASNGHVNDPRSLHYMQSGGPNSYEIALRSIGDIIRNYDTDALFPAFGFGAKIPPQGVVSHQFPLNNNPSHPYCRGIEEIISYYKTAVNTVTLHGPTNFAPVISNTANIARGLTDGRHYFVLLIITDGAISDMPETLDAIVNASSLPISIIIVGVGNADFSAMDFLDGDRNAIVSRGRRAERDIVQFVPLNKYVYGNWQQNQHELGRDVLAEIPTQMMQFMKSRGYKPNPLPISGGSSGGFPEPTSEMSSAPSQPYHPSSAPPVYPPLSQPPSAPSVPYAPQSQNPYTQPPPSTYPAPPQSYPNPPHGQPQGYPPSQSNYPPPNPSYPPTNPSYPPSNTSYPPTNPSYPSANPSYPPANPNYPPPQSNYPPPQSNYPPPQSNYPPPQSGYPPQQPAYPPSSQPNYPPQSGFPPGPQYPPQSNYPPPQSNYPPYR